MSKVLVTDTYLTDIADAIRAKTNTQQSYTLAQMPDAISSISSGGGSSYQLIYTQNLTANITSTSATNFTTISIGSAIHTANALVYVKIRDSQAPRTGYFIGTDAWFANPFAANGTTTTVTACGKNTYRCNSDGTFGSTDSGYGLYGYSINSSGALVLRQRYHSTYTLTINGTYVLEVYLLQWPDNISPFS